VKLRKPELAGVGLVSRSHQPGLVFTEPAIVSDVMRWRPDAGTNKKERLMEKQRCVWVVEFSLFGGNWRIMRNFIFATRQEARDSIPKPPGDAIRNRVVKYVPAETSKKAGGK
jgi:hypothetical protein